MKHDITAEKFGIRLRPVQIDDAALIVELRNSPHAVKYIGDSAKSVAEQEKWLRDYFERPDDYTFMIEVAQTCRPVGMLGVYDINGDTGEWGRWVIGPGVMAGPASAWLAIHICFEVLGLDKVRGLIVESNKQVLSFHRPAGYTEIGIQRVTYELRRATVRIVKFLTHINHWPTVSMNCDVFAKQPQP